MKQVLDKDQLRELVILKVNEISEVVEDGASVGVSDPQWHAEDELGRNWDVGFIRNGTEYGHQIKQIIDELRLKFRYKK